MRILCEELPGHDETTYWKTVCRILVYVGRTLDRL
jgi:hypothetical protein